MAGLYDFKVAEKLAQGMQGAPFDAIIMAALMSNPDTANVARVRRGFPELVAEVTERYNAPGGKLEGEH